MTGVSAGPYGGGGAGGEGYNGGAANGGPGYAGVVIIWEYAAGQGPVGATGLTGPPGATGPAGSTGLTGGTFADAPSDGTIYGRQNAGWVNAAGGIPKVAWVKFQGSAVNGNQTILNSYNVTSVVRNAQGVYTVNFTNPFSNGHYACSATDNANGVTNGWGQVQTAAGQTTTSCQIAFVTFGPAVFDPPYGYAMFFGN
jgi:hypothetical protein